MYFKKMNRLSFHLGFDETMAVTCPGRTPIEVVIRRMLPDDKLGAYQEATAVAVATASRRNKDHLVSAFQAFRERKLPDGYDVTPDLDWPSSAVTTDSEGAMSYEWHRIPEGIRQYIHDVHLDLHAAITRTARLTRWIDGAEIDGEPVQSGLFQASFDREEWFAVPRELAFRFEMSRGVRLTPLLLNEVTRLIAQEDVSEPLGHELVREARRNADRHPRSSLAIVVAAAETGIKQYVTHARPHTSWLIENTTSPPIVRILTDYLPVILKEDGFSRDGRLIPARLVDHLEKGVALRNKVVHGVPAAVDSAFVWQLISAVTDILWMLDYFRGFDWAKHHVTSATAAEWHPPSKQLDPCIV